MRGLANIPIIIALALIIGITPFAINQVQKSQILQNKAAPVIEKSILPCTELISAKNQYCSGSTANNNSPSVPCTDIESALTQYCSAVYQPRPSIITPQAQVTLKPKPTAIPTSSSTACTAGQKKCVGRIVFTCKSNQWIYTQVCPSTCTDGICAPKVTAPLPGYRTN